VYVPFSYILLYECLEEKDLEFYIKFTLFSVFLIKVYGFKYYKSGIIIP